MIQWSVDPASVDELGAWMAEMQERVIDAIALGMEEAMHGLAAHAAANAPRRSGEMVSAILSSPSVHKSTRFIRGRVSADVGQKHLGIWLEEGVNVPEVDEDIAFDSLGGEQIFSHGHKAFKVPAHPFMNQSLEEYETQIQDIIAEAISGAIS